MSPADREIQHIQAGVWQLTLADGSEVRIQRPPFDEILLVERERAKAYHQAVRDGIPPFCALQNDYEKRLRSEGYEKSTSKLRAEVFQELLESKEYNELLVESKDIPIADYEQRFAKLANRFIDGEKLSALEGAEKIHRDYFKQSADYFARLAATKALVFYSVYTASGERRYFESMDAVGTEDEAILRELISRVHEFIGGRGEAFFFI